MSTKRRLRNVLHQVRGLLCLVLGLILALAVRFAVRLALALPIALALLISIGFTAIIAGLATDGLLDWVRSAQDRSTVSKSSSISRTLLLDFFLLGFEVAGRPDNLFLHVTDDRLGSLLVVVDGNTSLFGFGFDLVLCFACGGLGRLDHPELISIPCRQE